MDYEASGSADLHPRLCPPSPLYSLLISGAAFLSSFARGTA